MKDFKIDYPASRDFREMKNLWQVCFGDSEKATDNFFKNSVDLKNTLCAFINNKPVGMLFLQECTVLNGGKEYPSYYIYGVCTNPDFRKTGVMTELFKEAKNIAEERNIDYLILVPANDKLFEMYRKQGFETSFYYEEKRCVANLNKTVETFSLDYESYIGLNKNKSLNETVAVLNEYTFNSFMRPVSENSGVFAFCGGYAVYEVNEKSVTVFEYAGSENVISAEILKRTEINNIIFRKYSKNKNKPYGMYFAVSDAPKIENGFFGVPYSN
ncbi:MAG: GNAT family N-acetyltransferase [Acutalibacteraceae bacterium]